MKTLPPTTITPPAMPAPLCPQHETPMFYVGRVPAWEDRRQQAHGWHCRKCPIEIQFPITEANHANR